MSLFKELEPFIEYIHSIRKLETYFSFDMKFPIKWGIPKSVSDNAQILPFDSGDENIKGISFVSKIEESDVNLNLNKILKIIKINKEREIKEKLFKETVEKLKSTFEKNDLNTLQTLYFDFQQEIKDEQNGEEPTTIELAE